MTPESYGRYRVLSQIGRGGMATVYQAVDPRIGRTVAVKVLSRELADDPAFLARFEREARTIAALEHPAIVPIYDFGEQDGQPYLVMRFMEGRSLRELIAQGPISLERSLSILDRVTGALQHAHDNGVIHRDLKPPNVFFDAGGNAFLGDFGIVRLSSDATTLTQQGAVLGSPAYMSPEQVQAGKELDSRSDIYSLGVILFEMLSGVQPYREETPAKVMMQHLLEPVPELTQVAPGLAPDCDTVVQRAMAKSPEDRYRTPRALMLDLETIASGGRLTPISPTLPPSEAATLPPETVPVAAVSTPPPEPPRPDLPPPPPEAQPSNAAAEVASPGRLPRRLFAAATRAALLLIAAGGLYVVLSARGGAAPPPPTPTATRTPIPTVTPSRTPSPEPNAAPTLLPEFYDLRFCDRPCATPGAVEVSTLPEGAVTIYLAWSYRGMRPGTRYTRSWSVEGEQWVHYECEWQGEAEGTIDVILREPAGLRSGPWKVSLRIDEQPPVESAAIVQGTDTFWDPPGFRPCPDTP